MRLLLTVFFALGLMVSSAWAEDTAPNLFVIHDVAVDITAANAAQARDQAIAKAQHQAYDQLLQALGVDAAKAPKINDDDIATLVQNFEVQSEKASSVRYIATFTVQFRESATRHFLGNHIPATPPVANKPLVVLPMVEQFGHNLMWEETTAWRTAWDKEPHGKDNGGLIVPAGDLADIGVISTDEVLQGQAVSLKAIAAKYHAGGVAVLIFHQPLPTQRDAPQLDIRLYGDDGMAVTASHLTLPTMGDKTTIDAAIAQTIRLARQQIDKDWKKAKPPVDTSTANASAQAMDATKPSAMPVAVPLVSLVEWAQIRARLNNIAVIRQVNVISLARGATQLDIVYDGPIDALRTALFQEGLVLNQNAVNSQWILRPAEPGEVMTLGANHVSQ